MRTLSLSDKKTRFIARYDTDFRRKLGVPALCESASDFRAHAKGANRYDLLQKRCKQCGKLSTLVPIGFRDNGDLQTVCLRCGVCLLLRPSNRFSFVTSGESAVYLTGLRDLVRKRLGELGVDWKTGRLQAVKWSGLS